MKRVLDIIIDVIVGLLVIGLYIATFMYFKETFTERKRKEITKDLVEKVEEEIKQYDEVYYPEEVKINYSGKKYTILGRITIKKIGIDEPILKENTYESYNVSAVKVNGPNLNEDGNVTIAAHNYMRGSFFIKINKLVKNDIVTIKDLSGKKIDYYVYKYGVTSIDDASYYAQPDDDSKTITLVTCTKGGKERYYVKAKAKSVK